VPDPKNPLSETKQETQDNIGKPISDLSQASYDYGNESGFSSLESSVASLGDFEPPRSLDLTQNIDMVSRNHPTSSMRTSSTEENVPPATKKRKTFEFPMSGPSPTPPIFGLNYRINVPSRNVPQSNKLFVEQILPSVEQEALRELLLGLLKQGWWFRNELEPNGSFSPFIEKFEEHRFKCVFCRQVHSRSDRAIAHCRKHLDHRPFACPGSCKSPFEVWYVFGA
jgi:hypothetical protein